MAIPVFDATNESTSSSASSLTYALTISSGGSLIVGAGSRDNFPPTGVTYNGTSMTASETTQGTVHIYTMASPDTGASHNVIASFTGTGACSSIAISVTGADTADLVGGTQNGAGSGTNPTESITTDTANSLVIDAVVNGAASDTFTPGGGQTQRGSDLSPGSNHTMGMSEEDAATVTSYTMDWSTSSQSWAVCAVEIHGASGGGGVDTLTSMGLLGVGM